MCKQWVYIIRLSKGNHATVTLFRLEYVILQRSNTTEPSRFTMTLELRDLLLQRNYHNNYSCNDYKLFYYAKLNGGISSLTIAIFHHLNIISSKNLQKIVH